MATDKNRKEELRKAALKKMKKDKYSQIRDRAEWEYIDWKFNNEDDWEGAADSQAKANNEAPGPDVQAAGDKAVNRQKAIKRKRKQMHPEMYKTKVKRGNNGQKINKEYEDMYPKK